MTKSRTAQSARDIADIEALLAPTALPVGAVRIATMPSIVIIGPNIPGSSEAHHIHALGCADSKRPIYRGKEFQADWKQAFHFADVKALTLDWYADHMSDMYDTTEYEDHWEEYASDFKIFPCAQLPWEVKVETVHIHDIMDQVRDQLVKEAAEVAAEQPAGRTNRNHSTCKHASSRAARAICRKAASK